MGWGVSGRISHTSGNFIYLRDGLAHILVSTLRIFTSKQQQESIKER